jgi:predicted trehalose synthase
MQSGYSLEGLTTGSKRDSSSGGVSSSGVGSISATDPLTNMEDTIDDDDVEMEEPETTTTTTTTTIDAPNDEEEDYTDEPFEQLKPAKVKQHPHIDYGTTLTEAYKNLEKMLGEGGLQNLTADTKNLMAQQSKLFNSMENIAPLLSQAQDLMKNMDMTQFSGGKVGGLADSAEQINKSKK